MIGTKYHTEVVGFTFSGAVGKYSNEVEVIVRFGGLFGSENLGLSNDKYG
jgi:hypothetical protein